MSLDKAIEHGKEHRKPYYRSARFDRTCRPGTHWKNKCPYCLGNRTVGDLRNRDRVRDGLDEVQAYPDTGRTESDDPCTCGVEGSELRSRS
jgi:hypothetical protein